MTVEWGIKRVYKKNGDLCTCRIVDTRNSCWAFLAETIRSFFAKHTLRYAA